LISVRQFVECVRYESAPDHARTVGLSFSYSEAFAVVKDLFCSVALP
jgi:hypothetical protein